MSQDDLLNSTLYAANAAAEDWDLSGAVGWNPDYEDPSTYLDIFNVKSGGVLQKSGIEPGESNDKAKAVGLDIYTQMLEEANKEQDPS